MSARRLTLCVPAACAGEKVDTLLRRELQLSGSVVKRAKFTPGGILLDGDEVFVSRLVRPGQVLSIVVGDVDKVGSVVPTPGPLEIVYEDEDVLVLDKPPYILVHPGPTNYDHTLGNFVADYYLKTGTCAVFRPVNRLDWGTSGLMVVAKHAHAHERLRLQLHTPDFVRTYLAVCEGTPAPAAGEVSAPIGRVEGSVLARCVSPGGAAARTRYETLETKNGRSLVRLTLDTGRTHQIRVHMAYLGCPLVGDFLYGTKTALGRPALHSSALGFCQPVTGERLCFTLPLPAELSALVERVV